jgi:hypothetical protein
VPPGLEPALPGLDALLKRPHPICACPSCRQHAAHLQQVAFHIQACCESLAAVIRYNAPVQPALKALEGLEKAFLELQRAVGDVASASPAASGPPERDGSGGPWPTVHQSLASSGGGASPSHECAQGAELQAVETKASSVADSAMATPSAAQDSLALHLALSTLFTCCSQVRAGVTRGCTGTLQS